MKGNLNFRLQISDCRLKLTRIRDQKSAIRNLLLHSAFDLSYSIVDPNCVYRYFFPSQNSTDEVLSPSPASSM